MNESRPTPQGLPGQHRPGIAPPSSTGPVRIPAMPIQSIKQQSADLDPISLVDEPDTVAGAPAAPSKIRAFGPGAAAAAHSFKRQPTVSGRGAVRVRTFHGRLSDEGMGFLDDKINEWLDQHPEIEVKFVTTTIGQFEGKIREPALVMNVWY